MAEKYQVQRRVTDRRTGRVLEDSRAQLQRATAEEAMPKQRIAMDRTSTNRRTGESETWRDVGADGENRPVAKTLRNVTVTGKRKPTERLARTIEERPRYNGAVNEHLEEVAQNAYPLDQNMRPVEPRPEPAERLASRIEERPLSEEELRRRRAEELDRHMRGALDRYGDDYQTIWQRGGYRNAAQRREERRQELLQEALERERMRIDNESNADRNAIMRYDRTKRKNNVGL